MPQVGLADLTMGRPVVHVLGGWNVFFIEKHRQAKRPSIVQGVLVACLYPDIFLDGEGADLV